MAVELSRTGWLRLFTELRDPSQFLSRMFTIKPGGVYSGKKVAVDIQRIGEDVALVVKNGTGPRWNDFDIFTTKEFEPPAYNEGFPLDVLDLLNRMEGVDPFTAAGQSYTAALVAKMAKGFALMDNKIKRGVELQASQVLQTGTLDLLDDAGATLYSLDFSPKATHFPTVGTAWSAGGADPLADLLSLAKVITADSSVNPDRILFGDSDSLQLFLRDDNVKAALDNRRMTLGEVAPQFTGSGATFYGHVWVGTYRLEIWAYPGRFKDPQTGNSTTYIANDKVVMTSSQGRMDMVSARVPLPLGPDPRVASLLPGRLTSRTAGFDVTPNVYCSPNGKQIFGELESRPLVIPVQIDGFGCLDTGI